MRAMESAQTHDRRRKRDMWSSLILNDSGLGMARNGMARNGRERLGKATQGKVLKEKNEMDISLVIAVVGVGIAMVGVMISMMFWVRSESNSSRKDAKEDRKDLVNLVRSIEIEVRDFHHQLLNLNK